MYEILLALCMILQILDGVTTYLAVSRGGFERNPLVRWFLQKLGLCGGLIVTKVLACVFAAVIYLALPVLLYLAAVIYLGVVLGNVSVLRRLR